MIMRHLIGLSLLLIVTGIASLNVLAMDRPETDKQAEIPGIEAKTAHPTVGVEESEALPERRIIAYYIHGNFRCNTCQKIETQSEEAILQAFENELDSKVLEFRIVNMDKEEHFAEDYQLVSQALVLVEMENGKQKSWKNLQKVWELVNNKDKFYAYVQQETREFLGQPK
jgi:hypothetical protein